MVNMLLWLTVSNTTARKVVLKQEASLPLPSADPLWTVLSFVLLLEQVNHLRTGACASLG